VRVASKVGNLPSKFGHARPLGSRIIRYVRDGRTDIRMDGQKQRSLSASLAVWLAGLIWLVWLSGNALASINVVALRQTRLVPGWVIVCGRVNHLGMQPAS